MEAMDHRIDRTPRARAAVRIGMLIPGIVACVLIAVVATVIGRLVPVIGFALPAIVIGVVIAVTRRPGARWLPGVSFSSKRLLQVGVVLLGTQLSLQAIVRVGLVSLPVMASTLLIALIGTVVVGRALGIERRLRTLIGVGTAICGASAIAAVAPVVAATSAEVAYAVSTIFVFNLTAAVLFPILGHLLHMGPTTFALFAGTAVNDTSSVVAAASAFSAAALGYAVVVKLVRTLVIIPVSVTLAAMEARRNADGERMTVRRAIGLVPWFLVGFLVFVILRSIGAVPAASTDAFAQVSSFLIATALAGVGLSTNLSAIRSTGYRPLLLGAILWALVTVTALGAIGVMHPQG